MEKTTYYYNIIVVLIVVVFLFYINKNNENFATYYTPNYIDRKTYEDLKSKAEMQITTISSRLYTASRYKQDCPWNADISKNINFIDVSFKTANDAYYSKSSYSRLLYADGLNTAKRAAEIIDKANTSTEFNLKIIVANIDIDNDLGKKIDALKNYKIKSFDSI